MPRLVELLDDLHQEVVRQAAIILGFMGKNVATLSLIRLLKDEPTAEIMEALVTIGDHECFVALGRIADVWPDLRHTVATALAGSEHHLAIAISRRIDAEQA